MAVKIESGLQLVTRLIKRPVLDNLDRNIFCETVNNTSIIEIDGSVSSGKTHLLTKLIAKFILPVSSNGCDSKVLFLNLDNHFEMQYLFNIVLGELTDSGNPCLKDKEEFAKSKIIEKLIIVNCYSHQDLVSVLSKLDNILIEEKEIAFLAIDSISTYFWQQKDDYNNISSYDMYLKKLLTLIQTSAHQFRVLTAYTKTSDFASKKGNERIIKQFVNYQIKLDDNFENNKCLCIVSDNKQIRKIPYKRSYLNFEWLKT